MDRPSSHTLNQALVTFSWNVGRVFAVTACKYSHQIIIHKESGGKGEGGIKGEWNDRKGGELEEREQ